MNVDGPLCICGTLLSWLFILEINEPNCISVYDAVKFPRFEKIPYYILWGRLERLASIYQQRPWENLGPCIIQVVRRDQKCNITTTERE